MLDHGMSSAGVAQLAPGNFKARLKSYRLMFLSRLLTVSMFVVCVAIKLNDEEVIFFSISLSLFEIDR